MDTIVLSVRAGVLMLGFQSSSMDSSRSEVTALLQLWSDGRKDALDRLLPQIYAELRRLASSYLRRERPDHTLQATALVHEAFIKLVDQRASAGRTARTSSASPHRPCGASWSITRVRMPLANAATAQRRISAR